jgi:hypothetical protein
MTLVDGEPDMTSHPGAGATEDLDSGRCPVLLRRSTDYHMLILTLYSAKSPPGPVSKPGRCFGALAVSLQVLQL